MDFYWSRSLCNIICGKFVMLREGAHCVMQVWPWVNEEGRKLVEGVHIIMMSREARSPVKNLDSKSAIWRVFFVSLQCQVIGQPHPMAKAASEFSRLQGTLINVTLLKFCCVLLPWNFACMKRQGCFDPRDNRAYTCALALPYPSSLWIYEYVCLYNLYRIVGH